MTAQSSQKRTILFAAKTETSARFFTPLIRMMNRRGIDTPLIAYGGAVCYFETARIRTVFSSVFDSVAITSEQVLSIFEELRPRAVVIGISKGLGPLAECVRARGAYRYDRKKKPALIVFEERPGIVYKLGIHKPDMVFSPKSKGVQDAEKEYPGIIAYEIGHVTPQKGAKRFNPRAAYGRVEPFLA